jgi:hypothetical protein
LAEPLNKAKARWPQEKQAAFDRLMADVARRLDALADEQGDALVVVKLQVHRGHFKAGRFDADTEYA